MRVECIFIAIIYVLKNYLTVDFVKISNCSWRYQESLKGSLNHVRFIPSGKCYIQSTTNKLSILVDLVRKATQIYLWAEVSR